MAVLRYPLQSQTGVTSPDYVQFRPLLYRANNNNVAGGAGDTGAFGGGAPATSGARDVILYMPNSTPAVGNENNWGPQNFAGPLGELQKLAGAGLVNTIDDQTELDIKQTIDNVKAQFEQMSTGKGLADLGNAGKQAGMQMIPQQIFGATGAQLLAMSKGKTFNPNVELLYTAPGMRAFNFTFTFVPKSQAEANAVNEIIMNFKKWSAPAEIPGAGMLEVPHVWQVSYMSGGKENQFMNKFKRAACTSVTVQANTQTSMHVAHDQGVPVETVMSLSFREVDIITRQDHEAVMGQGF